MFCIFIPYLTLLNIFRISNHFQNRYVYINVMTNFRLSWVHIVSFLFACSGIILKTYAAVPFDTASSGNLKFEENKRQWDSRVIYKADISGGRVFLEKNALTFVLHDPAELKKIHDDDRDFHKQMNALVHCHAYKMNFLGASPEPLIMPAGKLSTYYNYFLGNDSSRWSADVALYTSVLYRELYPGIDLKIYGTGNDLKYEFTVDPEVDPSEIKISYCGVDGIILSNNNLLIKTSVTDVTEFTPYVYQVIGGIAKEVKCKYELYNDSIVSFDFPEGYNKKFPLIIDPVIIASTYAGSTVDTWGHSATYDTLGNIYEGGRSFGQGYPVTLGAYQTVFSGTVDISIGKINPTGTSFIYATYIGGTGEEFVHSMITDASGNLYIYGSCGSADYPVTGGCYDNTSNGNYDIVVSKLNAAGNVLLASTYVGGSGDDGYNNVYFNYGDHCRGEIILDASNNPIIASFTASANFPATAGAYDPTYNGGQDGVVFKLNSNLTTMMWSTFLGGSGDDAAFGLQLNTSGNVYVVGATAGGFPTTSSVIYPSYQGGADDGFIAELSANGSSLLASTYIGTSAFDGLYFVDLDENDDVYVYGLSEGNFPVTPGVYYSPGSQGRLIIKLDPSLNSIIFSTSFGSGAIQQYVNDFSPTAFLVDICRHIYVAGWGNTNGYPVTGNALQPATDGQDFYLLVLGQDATSLLYATFYGDLWNIEDHVDGGTSRFDKNGIVYEAVCGCGTNFPTNTNAISHTNNTGTGSCDLAVFKIDFELTQLNALADAAPEDTACVPFTVNFINSSNGVTYFWDLGDGTTDTLAQPSHTYTVPGVYNVMLIATDSAKCNISDTTYLLIDALPSPVVNLGNDTILCTGNSLLLDAGNPGFSFLWSTGAVSQTITVTDSGTYWVKVDNGVCPAYDTIHVTVPEIDPFPADTVVCKNTILVLDAGISGSTYLWSTGDTSQTIIADSSGLYWVSTMISGCVAGDTVNVLVEPVPVVNLGNDTVYCQTLSAILDAGNPGCSYLWSTGASSQTINIDSTGTYWVVVSNAGCSAADTINISAVYPPNLGPDTKMCEQNDITLDAGQTFGSYLWSTGETTQIINVTEPGSYWVLITSPNCSVSDTINIEKGGSFSVFFPNTFTPDADGQNDVFKGFGEEITYYDLTIFTRWGQQIFHSTDPDTGWDGTFDGMKVQQGIYVMMADFKTTCTGWNVQHKLGYIFVLR